MTTTSKGEAAVRTHPSTENEIKAFEGRIPNPAHGSPIYDPKFNGRSTLTIEEAGMEVLGLSRWASYEAAKSGALPTIRIGRRLLVPRAALEKLLAA
jgi:excisionase family DNA binding protein